jgi:hypothetical protein
MLSPRQAIVLAGNTYLNALAFLTYDDFNYGYQYPEQPVYALVEYFEPADIVLADTYSFCGKIIFHHLSSKNRGYMKRFKNFRTVRPLCLKI